VRDTGRGMDRATLARIFEPFFTTKGPGEGSGLGLATVYGAVRQNHGWLAVTSAPGHGATFDIYLPRYSGTAGVAAAPASPAEVIAATAPARNRKTVLVVEDEPAILDLAARILVNQGYSVLRANGPREALRVTRAHAGEVHLLLTDVIMPEMNGGDLAKQLVSLHPGIQRLFMSGYPADAITHRGALDSGMHFIQKPFTMADLTAAVRNALAAKGP
jgi:CheY-like chemotaxis protein